MIGGAGSIWLIGSDSASGGCNIYEFVGSEWFKTTGGVLRISAGDGIPSVVNDNGGLVVHDAQREEYHQALDAVGQPLFLEPWESGQVCLVKKSA